MTVVLITAAAAIAWIVFVVVILRWQDRQFAADVAERERR